MAASNDSRGANTDPVAALERLEQYQGAPEAFWPACLEPMLLLAGADAGVLLFRSSSTGTADWRILAVAPPMDAPSPPPRAFAAALQPLADQCAGQGAIDERVEALPRQRVLGVRIRLLNQDQTCVGLFLVTATDQAAETALRQLRLAVRLPAVHQLQSAVRRAQADVRHFAAALDLMVLLNAQTRWLAAAITFCNELAGKLPADRVSLGWTDGAYVRLQAMSHTERFERKTEAVQALELAMEEAAAQNEEIIVPRPPDCHFVTRDHEAFTRGNGLTHVCSLPLRLGQETVGVLTCERGSGGFSELDLLFLRLCADQAVRRLSDLKQRDRWVGARLAAATRKQLAGLVGVEHTWAKVGALAAVALVATLSFLKLEFRVEAPFTVRSRAVAQIPAPFDGYIRTVHVEVGDLVRSGEPVIGLDTDDLQLELAAAQAERNRYLREAEKARSEERLAEMRIAEAMAEQARVRQELVEYRLAEARILAPFNAVVLRGDFEEDLNERAGIPVRRGDILVRAAQLDQLLVESEVDERDVDHVRPGAAGQIAFTSQPDRRIPVRVERIEPMAVARDRRNVFAVRCAFDDPPEHWYRPGMTGICKIDAGRRPVIWIMTRRTIDFLRLLLWW